jgi:hypothetical protein
VVRQRDRETDILTDIQMGRKTRETNRKADIHIQTQKNGRQTHAALTQDKHTGTYIHTKSKTHRQTHRHSNTQINKKRQEKRYKDTGNEKERTNRKLDTDRERQNH